MGDMMNLNHNKIVVNNGQKYFNGESARYLLLKTVNHLNSNIPYEFVLHHRDKFTLLHQLIKYLH
ncbi:MAG: hypothetical protein K0Q49_2111 [Haloplasmataceae bacterium]|jgi:hypothetical protein|nr:hypothetical protein [Haloplasmataceae bacterium]